MAIPQSDISVLILDSDLCRGNKLGLEIHERSKAQAMVTDDLGTALEAVRRAHPTLIVVNEDLGPAAAAALQSADPDAFVIIVSNHLAA